MKPKNAISCTAWAETSAASASAATSDASSQKLSAPASPCSVSDQFWGDRMGQVADPFGHVWSIATHVEDVSPKELAWRTQDTFAASHK